MQRNAAKRAGRPRGTAESIDASRESDAEGFDVLIMGSGAAGVAAAIQAAGMGATVGIVEAGTLGGTCVNVGCIPSKNLIEAAARYHGARRGFPGVSGCKPAFDWKAVLAQKKALVADLRQAKYIDVLQSYPDIAILHGRAELVDAGRVRVGDTEYTAGRVIVATGAAPALPVIPGLAEVDPLTSTSAMDLAELPESLLVLGAGSVGLELGQMFARLGVRVIVLELAHHILPNEDASITEVLREYLEADGIEIHTDTSTRRVDRDKGDVVLQVVQGSIRGEFRAQRILAAVGRRPNTNGMGFERAGVRLTAAGFIQVDTTMRTENERIYAAGDVTGGSGYVYVAAAAGRVAAENAVNSFRNAGTMSPRELDLSAVPRVTFTAPQVASVGLTERRARETLAEPGVTLFEMAEVPRALVNHETRGLIKVITDGNTGKLVGFHAAAPNAGEFLSEATMAIRFGLTIQDLVTTFHPYLTWTESVRLALQSSTMDTSRLSCCA